MNQEGKSPSTSKRIKLDPETRRKIIFAVKTSNEQNQDVEMIESCTFVELKPSSI